MRRRGTSLGQVTLLAALAGVFVALLALVWRRVDERSAEERDLTRMRHIYVALALYETTNDGLPAPDLLRVRRDLGDDSEYRAANDPFADVRASWYPLDPALPDGERAPIRIGFSYLGNFVRAGRLRIAPWAQAKADPRLGLLASFWYGRIVPTGRPFEARVDGPVLGLGTDGALYRASARGRLATPSAETLFLRR